MQGTYRRSLPVGLISFVLGYFIAAQPSVGQDSRPSSASAERIQRVESQMPPVSLGHDVPPLRLNLAGLMKLFNVPGVSVAVIDDYRIAWAKGYGVIEAGGATPVTTKTLFQAGSISKPVAAAAALYLVEAGKLSLDEDVNRKLQNWKVPENEFTKQQKVTLRRLLSHSAGINASDFHGYDVSDAIPTLPQVLNGAKPANSDPVEVAYVPGTQWQYSNAGFLVVQQLMNDVTHKPFPQAMREIVFDKLGMNDSTYEQPLPATLAVNAASGTYPDGTTMHGKWRIYPEMAAAGLWSTPSDLAKSAIEMALSKRGKSNHILSQALVRQMLTPQIAGTGNIPWSDGLGFFLDKKNPELFAHDGRAWAFQAILMMSADDGKGVAMMTGSDNGLYVASRLIDSVVHEYGWKTNSLDQNAEFLLGFVGMARGGHAAIQKFVDLKQSTTSVYQLDESSLDQVGHTLLESGKTIDAIEVFKANVQNYPKSADAYVSLAEAYMRSGQKQLALENYERSLTLAPDNQSILQAVRKLKEQK
jgi:CubicO group peptidase (beta-lactamase class C family)